MDTCTNRARFTVYFIGGRICGKTSFIEALKNIGNTPGIKFEEASEILSNFKKSLDNNEIKFMNPTYQECLTSI